MSGETNLKKMMNFVAIAFGAVALMIGTAGQAHAAAIILTPGSVGMIAGDTLFPPTGSANCEPECVELAFGLPAGSLLYKADVGDQANPATTYSGSFATSYTTAFANDPLDPADATISWVGAPASFITCPSCYLVIKDGNQEPSYYFYNLGMAPVWDGTSQIIMTGFWPQQGAISHVAIWGAPAGDGGGDDDGGTIPEPATLLLMAGGLGAAAYSSRRRRKA